MEEVKEIFPVKGIYEVIIGSNGLEPNLSPLGLHVDDTVSIRPFSNTLTFSNISVFPFCTIMVTHDPLLFYKALTGHQKSFKIIYGLPVLPVSCIIIARCKFTYLGNPARVELDFFDSIGSCDCPAFSRGAALFIDSLVHFTRIGNGILPREREEELLRVMEYEFEVIERTYPTLREEMTVIRNELRSKGYNLE